MNLLSVFLFEQKNVLAMLFLEMTQLEAMLVFHLSDRVVTLFQVSLLKHSCISFVFLYQVIFSTFMRRLETFDFILQASLLFKGL